VLQVHGWIARVFLVTMPTNAAPMSGARDVSPDFVKVLDLVVGSLQSAGVPFGLIGGIASAAYGRPRNTQDIDVFCRVEHAASVLDVLSAKGFDVERTNPTWIYKAALNDVLVDVIFKAKSEVYFDDAMQERIRIQPFWGVDVPIVPPEDVIVTKAIATDESSPAHWWDALAIVSETELDWEYLLERARKGPNRVASLLHFALSVDVPVPTAVVRQLDGIIAANWMPAGTEEATGA
jgi:predicted nucleotidyltransferase